LANGLFCSKLSKLITIPDWQRKRVHRDVRPRLIFRFKFSCASKHPFMRFIDESGFLKLKKTKFGGWKEVDVSLMASVTLHNGNISPRLLPYLVKNKTGSPLDGAGVRIFFLVLSFSNIHLSIIFFFTVAGGQRRNS